ncbi:MAG: hypothetical protein J5916_05815 [Oscillospiraceae bacterium]|nr:hypothetical protein [Oscillospiraceae bacterium]
MRQKLMQFMIGRNGNDELNRFLLAVDMVLILLSVIFNRGIGRVLSPIALVLLGFTYYRMLSRDLIRRSDENARYFRLRERFLGMIRVRKEQWVQRKDYKFFVCPACKATLRVPKGRGKIKIVCRKCGNSFMGKS